MKAREIAALLNDAFSRDPGAIRALSRAMVPCNRALADHPTVRVRKTPRDDGPLFSVGLLGILNGLTGDPDEWVEIERSSDGGEIVGFRVERRGCHVVMD